MVVETATGREIVRQTLKTNPAIPSSSARTAEDSGRLSVRTRRRRNTGPRHALLVWDAETGAEIRTIPAPSQGMDQGLRSVPTAITWRP